MISQERSCTSQTSYQILCDWLDHNDLKYQITRDHHSINHVDILDSTEKIVCSGSGKGVDYHVGGLAEAIEHYYTIHHIETPDRLKTTEITKQTPLNSCGIIHGLNAYPHDCVACIPYYPWNKNSPKCYIPQILVNPWKIEPSSILTAADRYLARYSTNSGIALGITTEDAVLHGICEEIERHYLSHFFMKESALNTNFEFQEIILQKGDWLDNNPYKKALDDLEYTYNFRIIFSEFFKSISFCVVIGQPKDSSYSPLSLIGSGASMNGRVAVCRALGEFVQTHLFFDAYAKKTANRISRNLIQIGRLSALLNLQNIHYKKRSSHKIPQTPNMPSRSMIDLIALELNEHGFCIFYKHLNCIYESFKVVSIYVPKIERFHLIRSGNIVAPQEWLQYGSY